MSAVLWHVVARGPALGCESPIIEVFVIRTMFPVLIVPLLGTFLGLLRGVGTQKLGLLRGENQAKVFE